MKQLIVMLLSSVVTGIVVCNYTPQNHSEVLAIASPLATIAGILFGFVIASSSLFTSISKNVLIENLKNHQGMYRELMEQLHRTGMWLISSCIFMVVSIFSPDKELYFSFKWDHVILMAGFWFMICGLIDFWDSWRKVRLVVVHL
ncbi:MULTISPECIES: hypothetical protein [Shewanella]|uniref:hypothetical protein n=1 Tax=Shewanella TaxID=22 RepID=UPI000647E2F1|nr:MULTISPECIES: hypothetical protein [Shewanella]MCD8560034.1 hypothetical protein [Shewanella xiamenensis]NSM26283.1 hypothetical protein [Shewanella sp. ZOR0012]ODR84651.1 hypothetical protein ABT47_04635 [Shewanella xiamenensis]